MALLSNANISWDGVALNQSKRSAVLDQVMLAKLVLSSSLIDQRRLVAECPSWGLGLRSVEAHAEAAFVGCLESNKWVSE